jgi:hypothetical protein
VREQLSARVFWDIAFALPTVVHSGETMAFEGMPSAAGKAWRQVFPAEDISLWADKNLPCRIRRHS